MPCTQEELNKYLLNVLIKHIHLQEIPNQNFRRLLAGCKTWEKLKPNAGEKLRIQCEDITVSLKTSLIIQSEDIKLPLRTVARGEKTLKWYQREL